METLGSQFDGLSAGNYVYIHVYNTVHKYLGISNVNIYIYSDREMRFFL